MSAKELSREIAKLEKELREMGSPIHSTPMPHLTLQSDSGIITTKRASSAFDQSTINPLQTPVGQSDMGSGARPKTILPTSVHKLDNGPKVREGTKDHGVISNVQGSCSVDKPQVSSKLRHRDIKVANFDGTGDWNDYRSHFEACASINGWDNHEKGLYLAAALRGQAQGVLGDLPEDKRGQYEQLVKSLEERFAPPNQNELYRVQLKERRQRASETLPELGQAIRRLVNKAYPRAPGEVRETLAMEHFIDSLVNSELRIKIKQSRPTNLNTAICLAVELETFYKAEKNYESGRAHLRVVENEPKSGKPVDKSQYDKIETMFAALNEQLLTMRKELDEFKKKVNTPNPGNA